MAKSTNSIVKEFIASYEIEVLKESKIDAEHKQIIGLVLEGLNKYADVKYPIFKPGRKRASSAGINRHLWKDCQLSALSIEGGVLYLISMFDRKSVWDIKYRKGVSPFGGQVKRLVRLILTMESMGFIKYNEPAEKIIESYNFLSQYVKMSALSGYRTQYREFEDAYPEDLKKIDKEMLKKGIARIGELYHDYFQDVVNCDLDEDFKTFVKYRIAVECLKEAMEAGGSIYGKTTEEWDDIAQRL